MILDLHKIDPEGQALDVPLPAAALAARVGEQAEYRPGEDGRMCLHLTREAGTVAVRGEASMPFVAQCSRCLGALSTQVRARVRHRLLPGPAAGTAAPAALEGSLLPGPEEPDADDEGVLPPRQLAGERIDLVELVGEDLLLALPMRALCRADCPGLCPACGSGREEGGCSCVLPARVDPRMAALARFR